MWSKAAVRWLIAFLTASVICSAGAWLWLGGPLPEQPKLFSQQAFERWLEKDSARQENFTEFNRYLVQHDVSGVVPVWQLTRTDSDRSLLCRRPVFLIPPKHQWPNMVPVLIFIRDYIEPRVGHVEVVSSYRTSEFNGCVGGASKSRHMQFAAVDLIVPEQKDNRALFQELCAIHRELGAKSGFGLGAYFDPLAATLGKRGRFHVDVSGFRSWGYSKHADSSGCKLFR